MNRNKLGSSRNAGAGASPAWIVGILVGAAVACGGSGTPRSATQGATIGPAGGEIVGAKGSALEGVKLTIPAGALAADMRVEIAPSAEEVSLPDGAARAGPHFAIGPAGTTLALPARLTLPVDEAVVTANERFDDEVEVFVRQGDHVERRQQVESAPGTVTAEISSFDDVGGGVRPPAPGDVVHFDLHANEATLNCLAEFPGDAQHAPSVDVTVVRGSHNDGLFLRGRNVKPGLKFDLFTVEHTNLTADGTFNPAFRGFGLATYQSDLQADDDGQLRATIRTILLDDAFSFDPATGLAPTSAFNVGFWFDDPNDLVPCHIDPAATTPFNGDHKAGPLAMISTPDATTGLGPLCTHPDTSTTPARCSP